MGVEGDAMNALPCCAGHKMRNILTKLCLLCAQGCITLRRHVSAPSVYLINLTSADA